MNKKLTIKQDMFCLEYIIDFNATQAAIRAGYSQRTAQAIGAENLTKPLIQACIAELIAERVNAVSMDAQYVLKRLVDIDKLDVLDILDDSGCMKAIKDWPKEWRISISGLDVQDMMSGDVQSVIKKIKWPDKLKNLELLGRHIDVKAWDGERTQDNSPIQVVKIEVVGAS